MKKEKQDVLNEVCYQLIFLAESLSEMTDTVYSILETLSPFFAEQACQKDERKTEENGEAVEGEGETLAVEILKAVFNCLSEMCEKCDAD